MLLYNRNHLDMLKVLGSCATAAARAYAEKSINRRHSDASTISRIRRVEQQAGRQLVLSVLHKEQILVFLG